MAAVSASRRWSTRVTTPPGVLPPCRSRSSWVLSVALTDSISWRNGLRSGVLSRLRSPLWAGRMSSTPCSPKNCSRLAGAVPLVGEDPLASSQQRGLGFEEVPGDLALVDPRVGQGEGDRQPGRCAHEVQAKPPEPARVAGAVAIGGPAGEIRTFDRRTGTTALDGRRVHDPGVVVPELGVAGQQADHRPQLALCLAEPLVVARLVRDVGEPGAQVHLGVTQEPRSRR